MTDADLASRRPVWVALSDLFLDTDVRLSYLSIVRTISASPYSLDELWRILVDEVTPALQGNLMIVAGEWAAFDEDWVVERCAKCAGKRRWLPNAVDMADDWRVLAELIERLRALPDEVARSRRLEAWQPLMDLLLSKAPAARRDGPELTVREAQRILRDELMPLLMPSVRQRAQESPSGYPSEAEVEANWRRFAESLDCYDG